jgi:glycosyltransferase involved in cell wall biosynthesis
MRIGFDGTCLANRRGFGRFSRLLLEALATINHSHQLVVVIDATSEPTATIPEGLERLVVKVSQAPAAAASSQSRRAFRDMLAMGRAVAAARLDLMYFPATYTFFPVWNVPRLVVTMHDTLALAHPKLVFPTRRGRLAWLLKEHAAVRWADQIVTVSETSKRDLQRWFRLPDHKLRTITEGPDPIFVPRGSDRSTDELLRKYAIRPGARYLLYVGGLSPHKNLPMLIKAFSRVTSDDVSLVLVGDLNDVFHTHVPMIRAAIAEAGLEHRVVFTGFVPDVDLVHLYNQSLALVQPSLMEGFGLPAVEAMACGIPVVSSRAGSLPEVVGDAGLFFDPRNVDSIACALNSIIVNPRQRDDLARRALKRSSLYSWNRAARALLQCFDDIGPPTRTILGPAWSRLGKHDKVG